MIFKNPTALVKKWMQNIGFVNILICRVNVVVNMAELIEYPGLNGLIKGVKCIQVQLFSNLYFFR